MIPALEAIIEAGCRCHGITRCDLFRPTGICDKSRRYVRARDQTLFIARRMVGASYYDLARHFGYRCHSSIIDAVQRATWRFENDAGYREQVKEIEHVITCGLLDSLRAEVARLEAAVNGGGA